MGTTPERVHEFMQIYKDEYNEDITEDEAREYIRRLMHLYTLLTEPLPSEIAAHAAKESEPK